MIFQAVSVDDTGKVSPLCLLCAVLNLGCELPVAVCEGRRGLQSGSAMAHAKLIIALLVDT